jgi:hypothetical protein
MPDSSSNGNSGNLNNSENEDLVGDSATDEEKDVTQGEGFDRAATELYSSASEAMDAIKKGASNYDDVVLEQFVDLGKECSWCDEFYGSLRGLATSKDISEKERAYYSEILAISGRVENIKQLVESIEANPGSEEANVYSEALEIGIGGDDVVKYLESKLEVSNQELRESVVAAISNQGSAQAVETLFKHIRAINNPDGYYSEGTGPGEVIPEPAAFPFLKSEVSKKDQFSPNAVRSLLNAGIDGARAVIDTLSSSPNPERDRDLLNGAADHVGYDEESEEYFKQVASTTTNPAIKEFADKVLESFKDEAP